MKNLLQEWDKVRRRLQMAQHIILLCDYDGTLTPIAARPELAVLPSRTKSLLTELNHQAGVTVGIISGRSLDDLKKKVSITDLVYAGNHGMEISGPRVNYTIPLSKKMWELLGQTGAALREQLGNITGIIIEDKGLTLSVHYRLVAENKHQTVRKVVESVTNQHEMKGRIKVTHGKRVFEIRPEIEWDKGRAVSLLMELLEKERGQKDFFPIYLGDDSTDEDGFQAVNQTGNGTSVLVSESPRESMANYFLESTEDVEKFLTSLLLITSGKSQEQA